jgi:hypothetical protein
MYKKFHMRFGQYTFAFLCDSQAAINFLNYHYIENTSDLDSSIPVFLSIVPNADLSMIKPGKRYSYSINNDRFNFGPNLIQGSWDGGEKYHLFISNYLLRVEEVWLINRFLCRLFYTLSRRDKAKQEKTFIVHSSAVLKNRKVYIFFGPPESGKSTIANNSKQFKVLHDDMNIVTISGGSVSVEGVPFNPNHLEFARSRGTLSMICSLHKNNSVKLEKGAPGEFAEKLLPEVILPLSVSSEDRKEAFQYLLSCVKTLVKMIPFYHLYFKKDDSFWQEIDKVEEHYGKCNG